MAARLTDDDRTCGKCGEQRLTEIIETAGRRVGVCKVCAHDWKLEKAG